MTRIPPAEMQRRLRAALSHQPSEETRLLHLASIEAALRELPTPVESRPERLPLRRWVAVAAATAAGLSPVGVAVAAEQAVPGDALYQVKLVTEPVRAVVDPLVVARHRIDELESLIERRADPSVIEAARSEAWASVSGLEEGHPLLERLERLNDRITEPDEEPAPSRGEIPPPPVDERDDDDEGSEEVEEESRGEDDQDDVDSVQDDDETQDDDLTQDDDDDGGGDDDDGSGEDDDGGDDDDGSEDEDDPSS